MASDRAIEKLTKAIWALVVVFGVFFAVIFWLLTSSYLTVRSFEPSTELSSTMEDQSLHSIMRDIRKYNDFHKWSKEKQFAEASVVAIVEYEETETDMKRAVFTEFLKIESNVNFEYSVGDEFSEGSYYPAENEHRGQGMLVFFVGNPPENKMSVSISNERVMSYGNIKLSDLKRIWSEET